LSIHYLEHPVEWSNLLRQQEANLLKEHTLLIELPVTETRTSPAPVTERVILHRSGATDETAKEPDRIEPGCAAWLRNVRQRSIGTRDSAIGIEDCPGYPETNRTESLNVAATLATSACRFPEAQIDALEYWHVPVWCTLESYPCRSHRIKQLHDQIRH